MTIPVRIVARAKQGGVARDVRLLSDAMAAWRDRPDFSHYRSINPFRRFYGAGGTRECIIFLERVTARWLGRPGPYVLIPNQERYPERLVRLLHRLDHIFCKTLHAREIFADHHRSVRYIGFTSADRDLAEVRPDYSHFFHLAGSSTLKGTGALLELWGRHPEWPTLTLVQHPKRAPRSVPANVNLIDRFLPDVELRRLQNSCGVHLCPSLSEGWGHYIAEAMSCRAVTLTTDAPPMNELVGPDRGILVPYGRSEQRKLGFNFHVDPSALEEAIAELIGLSDDAKQPLGEAGRRWYEQNDRTFRANLRRVTSEVLPEMVS